MIEAGRIVAVPRPSRIRASVSARFDAPEIDPAVVGELLRGYGLAEGPAGAQRNLRLARRSRNVVVHAGERRLVLKLYRDRWQSDTVTSVHSTLCRLEALGIPAPRLVRTPDGRTWTPVGTGPIAALFEWIPGRNHSITYLRRSDRLRLTSMAGDTLAGLHAGLEGFEPDGAHHMGFISLTGPRRRDLAWHVATLEELAARSKALEGEASEKAAELVRRTPAVLEEVAALQASLDELGLPRVVIHGDFGLHNLLFRPVGPAIPVDFELSRIDWRVNDLISVIGKHRRTDGSYDLEAMATLLRAYAIASPLSERERHHLPDAWRLYKLQAGVQYWNSFFDTGGPVRKLGSALDAIDQARWPDLRPDAIAVLSSVAAGATAPPSGVSA